MWMPPDAPAATPCIAPRAGKKDGDTVYTVTVVLDEQPQGLRWGMSAEVRIEAGK